MLSLTLALATQTMAAPKAAAPAQPERAITQPAEVFELEIDPSGRVAHARARNITVADAAKRLGAALKVPVNVAPALAKTRVTFAKMDDVALATLLLRLAPAACVDTRETLDKSPQLLAVHLLEQGVSAPPEPMIGPIAIEGNTEDTSDAGSPAEKKPSEKAQTPPPAERPADAPFLDVRRMEGGRIAIDARDQGLGVLLFEVAQAYGVRFDLRIPEAPMVGRFSVVGVLPSELPAYLGLGGVGIDIRRNLATGEETPLRVFVEPVP